MKNYKSILPLFIASFLFNVSASTAEPVKCPSVSEIRAAKLDVVGEWNKPIWSGKTNNKVKYDTNDYWTLEGFFTLKANNEHEALIEANEAMASLQFAGGPFKGGSASEPPNDNSNWGCWYTRIGYENDFFVAGTGSDIDINNLMRH